MKKRETFSRSSKAVLLVLCAALVLSALTMVLYAFWYTVKIDHIPMNVVVTEQGIGFNLETGQFYFGKAMPESLITRGVTFRADKRLQVAFETSGQMENWTLISENPVMLDPDVEKDVTFWVVIPTGTPAGNYTGTLTARYTRRMFR